jgi:uncharacterized phage infection (PIP) family protein YhgE
LILLAIFGMVFSAFGVYGIWMVRSAALVALDDSVELISVTLETTAEGLRVVDGSLDAATDTLTTTAETTETLAQTLGEISTLANGIMGLVNFVGGGSETPESQSGDLAVEVQRMTNNLTDVTNNLGQAQSVVDDYQLTIDNAQAQLDNIQQGGPTWITAIAVVMTIILVWLAIAQIGLLLQGAELIRK